MRRVKDLLGRKGRRQLREAAERRKDYYRERVKSTFTREKIIQEYFRSTECRKLHLGAGGLLIDGWLNSDILDIRDGMIFLDVRTRFPFPDKTFDFVYSEHLLEHLKLEGGVKLLRECYRVLREGGICRISTPNLAFLVDLYEIDSEENREYLRWAFEVYWRSQFESKAEAVNYYFRGWGHKFIYDFDLLKRICEQVGFENVRRVQVGGSMIQDLENIEKHGSVIGDRWNRKESLVIEADKTRDGN